MAEKIKINVKEILICALSLAIIAAGITAALALTNAATAGRIEELYQENQSNLRQQVIDADSFAEIKFAVDDGEVTCYTANKGDELVGYVFTVSSTGKSSGLVVMTGISVEGKVTGVVIVDENETAGYVDKVKKAGFLGRLTGWDSNTKLKVGSNIDGASQATKTVKGIAEGVNKALEYYHSLASGEGK